MYIFIRMWNFTVVGISFSPIARSFVTIAPPPPQVTILFPLNENAYLSQTPVGFPLYSLLSQ
jgi:hypothetical protein